jgi:hypothetical protein
MIFYLYDKINKMTFETSTYKFHESLVNLKNSPTVDQDQPDSQIQLQKRRQFKSVYNSPTQCESSRRSGAWSKMTFENSVCDLPSQLHMALFEVPWLSKDKLWCNPLSQFHEPLVKSLC